jgi:tetratricopeptide (TPR) repeat protein
MMIVLTCSQGHRWEVANEELVAAPTARLGCPVCGAGYVRLTPSPATDVTPTIRDVEPVAVPDLPAIPGYAILGRLGRGGMGVVYKARHLRLNRLVALKMILAGTHAGPDSRARFHLEAEALASLQHPNIVQIHEVGEHQGCPYLALEFVDGSSLDRHLDGALLAPVAAARFVQTLAEAMHHAHQRGLIHRDLKPGNILLQIADRRLQMADSGRSAICNLQSAIPKITDFGLAKRLHEGGQTETGAVMGTPPYMAPEQVEGRSRDLGPATDVYALGTILYEMLTGQPPFGGDTLLQTLELVRSQPPRPPSQMRPGTPADLETICLKCLEKDPRRRYATAQALADDLRRFQAGEPITARPVGRAERALKWARRRPALAGLLLVSAIAVVALAGLGTWSNLALRAAAARERQERQRAEARSRLTRQAVEDMYTQVAERWLADEPHKDPLQRAFLEKALAIYQELAHDESGDAAVRRETARAYYRVGRICQDLGERDRAGEAYGRAIELQEQLWAEQPAEPAHRQDLATTCNWLGELRRTGGRPPAEAEDAYRKALALQEQLAADFPNEPAYQADEARTCYNLGIAHLDSNRLDEAEADYGRAIRLLDELAERVPGEPRYRQELARSLADRGILYRVRRRFPLAEADYGRAIGLLEPLQTGPQSRPVYQYELAVYENNLGILLIHQQRHAEAKPHHEHALALLRRLVVDFPARPAYRQELANTCNSLGAVLVQTGKDDEAAAERWEQARDQLSQLVGQFPEEAAFHYNLGMALGNLGWLRLRQNDLRQARRLLEEGNGQLEALLTVNPDHPGYLEAIRNQYRDLGTVLVRLGEHEAAQSKTTALARALPNPHGLCLAADLHACCIAAVARAPNLSAAERDTLTARYAGLALDCLRQALRGDPAVLQRVKDDPALEPLRSREEFKRLPSR